MTNAIFAANGGGTEDGTPNKDVVRPAGEGFEHVGAPSNAPVDHHHQIWHRRADLRQDVEGSHTKIELSAAVATDNDSVKTKAVGLKSVACGQDTFENNLAGPEFTDIGQMIPGETVTPED